MEPVPTLGLPGECWGDLDLDDEDLAGEAARKEIAVSECMSRAAYARHLRSLLGEDAIDGQDVFHIIANSNGGRH